MLNIPITALDALKMDKDLDEVIFKRQFNKLFSICYLVA